MRVLIFHGYLLRGTGSNVYNANLAQALVAARPRRPPASARTARPARWTGSTRVGTWEDGELTVAETRRRPRPATGSITAYLPDIGGVLPVYVADTYAGFDARPFPDLSEAEVEAYIDANVAAVRDVCARAGGVDAALANHLVMGPVILARAADALGAVRRQGPRQRPLLHGDPAPALPPLRPRGDGGGRGRPRRLPPHRREPLGDGRARRPRARRRGSARPASTSRRSRRCPTGADPAAELEAPRRHGSRRPSRAASAATSPAAAAARPRLRRRRRARGSSSSAS